MPRRAHLHTFARLALLAASVAFGVLSTSPARADEMSDQMAAAAREMQLLYAERLPLIPVFTPNTVWVNHSKVVGWQPNQANLYPWYNDVWIAQ